MTIDYIGPNQRGTAKRDPSKVVRCGTHLTVLKQVFETFKPITAIEHGCGHNSTQFFADNFWEFTSIEDVSDWKINHEQKIVSFDEFMQSPEGAECFLIDGRHEDERLAILNIVLEKELASFIVMHDAESYAMYDDIIEKAEKFGYRTFQYVRLNPETFLFVKKEIDTSEFDFEGYVNFSSNQISI